MTAIIAARVLGLTMFDVQLQGAVALAEGKIAEMQTGEGKTLAAVPAIVWYAKQGKGVHVMTANELARRDAQWMNPIYQFLGLSVGCIQQIRIRRSAGAPTPATSPMGRRPRLASTTCVTSLRCTSQIRFTVLLMLQS